MFVNHSLKQVTAKIVYYGPGLSGKTTNLQYIFSVTNPKTRGELVSIETEIERTLFFDLLPLNVGLVKGYQTKIQLYTVPGQIFYDSTRKLVLKGADGIVFVVDSQELREQAGLESFENLKTNLAPYSIDIKELPLVYQFNKRDLDNISSVERLKKVFNIVNAPYFEAVATNGTGVIETLKEISSLTLKKVIKLIDRIDQEVESVTPPPAPSINFDTDTNQEIRKFDDLPVKKIPMEEIEAYSEQLMEGQEEIFDMSDGSEKEYDTIVTNEAVINLPDDDEEVFTLGADDIVNIEEEPATRIFSRDEFDTMIEKEDKASADKDLPFADLPEEDIGENDLLPLEKENSLESKENAAANVDLSKQDEFATIVKKEEDFPFEDLPEQDLDDLSKISGAEEAVAADDLADLDKMSEPGELKDTGNLKDSNEINEIGELEGADILEYDLNKSKVFDVLKKFEDQTRIAVIRKVPLQDPQLFIDIKDKNGKVLETLELYVNPEIKKVTVILDVKKD